MQPLRQLYLSGDSWYIRVFLGMVWYGAAPCKLSGVALVEELVENIPNSLFRTAFPLLGSPRHHQRFTNMQRKSQSLMISYICNYKLVVLWDLFDGFARAWEVRRQIKVANFWGKLWFQMFFYGHLHVGGWWSTGIRLNRKGAFKESKVSQMFKTCTMGLMSPIDRIWPIPPSFDATVHRTVLIRLMHKGFR